MLKISLLIILLLLCFPALTQKTKKETMLRAHKLLEKDNWKEAEKLVMEYAENGDAEAQYLMTKLIGIKIIDLNGKRYDEGVVQAKNWLGKANNHDWLLTKNPSDEDSIRTQYVAISHNPDYTSTGNLAPEGSLIFKEEKRIGIIRKAAEKNILDAQLMYSTGLLLRGDSLEGIKWLNMAADNKHSEALYQLGALYSKGKWLKKDISKALDCFSKSLETGWGKAAWSLGYFYYEGKEVERDLDKAIYYFDKAYLLSEKYNHTKNSSLFRLGAIYVEKKAYQKAISMYQLVDDYSNDIGEARFRMGEIYATLKQYNKAVYWLSKSNYKDANRKLKEIRNR
ncbi:tetratricopeptide repeat protein [Emticicia agri]|uniref:Sel1 repeat family protein n=1 Tax=Emticicia agri TaxID=2492393 RepID=A0A4Q5LWS3_9BACT|nr:tetratricopeptide repeat protein [Emticicia agri]RYU94266.1 sel1 repeat family protein [Emticicia agri]